MVPFFYPITIGSSPHVRGTSHHGQSVFGKFRFIPARAGNIVIEKTSVKVRSVHPRTCGEHLMRRCGCVPIIGSSPHVRGTSNLFAPGVLDARFIPARAGNISPRHRAAGSRSVHPRTCGEHSFSPITPSPVFGSSPHVRGTYENIGLLLQVFRFIPARAGNIPSTIISSKNGAVHPRTCGEHRHSRSMA